MSDLETRLRHWMHETTESLAPVSAQEVFEQAARGRTWGRSPTRWLGAAVAVAGVLAAAVLVVGGLTGDGSSVVIGPGPGGVDVGQAVERCSGPGQKLASAYDAHELVEVYAMTAAEADAWLQQRHGLDGPIDDGLVRDLDADRPVSVCYLPGRQAGHPFPDPNRSPASRAAPTTRRGPRTGTSSYSSPKTPSHESTARPVTPPRPGPLPRPTFPRTTGPRRPRRKTPRRTTIPPTCSAGRSYRSMLRLSETKTRSSRVPSST